LFQDGFCVCDKGVGLFLRLATLLLGYNKAQDSKKDARAKKGPTVSPILL